MILGNTPQYSVTRLRVFFFFSLSHSCLGLIHPEYVMATLRFPSLFFPCSFFVFFEDIKQRTYLSDCRRPSRSVHSRINPSTPAGHVGFPPGYIYISIRTWLRGTSAQSCRHEPVAPHGALEGTGCRLLDGTISRRGGGGGGGKGKIKRKAR